MAEENKRAPKLFDRIGMYFDGRKANGADGLRLLNECIVRTASKDRDWDALARFIARSAESGQAAKVKKIVRAAFGNKLTFVMDKKHPAGGRFVLGWEGAFPLRGQNSYSFITKAVADGVSWDDAAFSRALNEVVEKPAKPPVKVDPVAVQKAAVAAYKYLHTKIAAGMPQEELMALVIKMVKDGREIVIEKGQK